MDLTFEEEVGRYLKKCELEYRTSKSKNVGAISIGWLEPYCNSTHEIAKYLRTLGFKISEICSEYDAPDDSKGWVVTTSGIVVYVNDKYSRGLVSRGK